MKKTTLGKGLESLIPKADKPRSMVNEIDITEIYPNPDQPRKIFDEEALAELTDSIRRNGIIQPIVLAKAEDGYVIIAGERRWRAAGLAGLRRVPAVVREITRESEQMELALIENIQREDLGALELARAYKNLMETHGYRQEDVAEVVGKSRSAVANTIRLLGLPSRVIEALELKQITEGHARCLIGLDEKKAVEILIKIIENNLSVRETEKLASKKEKPEVEKAQPSENVFLLSLKSEMEEFFKTQVEIKSRKDGGTIEIKYTNNDELDRIIKTIRGELS
ncbi:ParB/RepB/Spo0J family partition protein [Seleniivibrio woodruffii]|uniref:ParB family chromosome partitioning protein n=1 Tax=Seleniivibrio woodruffii TaxID=1078050 RepID=A0A4R1KCC4_9BACT|nr:ParB/RepB/Spo0J family partition protein [Seleniivibrio woodruffii]TCK61787.1 ParB family chromosome partitioning protein [Seleniivibrio woodruffii]TVZ35098.1 ParB family chromosome partitioning protein [Seleniivibrio woodruffii]